MVNMLEPALGLQRGDANIIKNAGNTRLDRELLRSLSMAIYALGAKHILVIGHSNCGMTIFKAKDIYRSMVNRGIKKEHIEELDLENWLGTYDDEKNNVIRLVEQIKESKIIPDDIDVHGLIIDVDSGALEILI